MGLLVTPPMTASAQDEPTIRVAPFDPTVPKASVDAVIERVRDAKIADTWSTADWSDGVDFTFMAAMRRYWIDGYDWSRFEKRLASFENLMVTVDGVAIHVLRKRRADGGAKRPLLLFHGWPHNASAFLDVANRLADPERFGGSEGEGFDVVVPSFPGAGFSPVPDEPIGPKRLAVLMHEVMQALGYETYMVQGTDMGAAIAPWMAINEPEAVRGIHLSHFFVRPAAFALGSGRMDVSDATDEEKAFAAREAKMMSGEPLAYFFQQGERPQTLAYALADSPLGTAAWYWDRFYTWSDNRGRTPDLIFSRDHLIDELMLYLVTGTQETATWVYRGAFEEQGTILPDGVRVETATGILFTRDPLNPPPPRGLAARVFDVRRFVQADRGGHWPMLETPDLYVTELRAFAKQIKY